jgi:hypothetical protein
LLLADFADLLAAKMPEAKLGGSLLSILAGSSVPVSAAPFDLFEEPFSALGHTVLDPLRLQNVDFMHKLIAVCTLGLQVCAAIPYLQLLNLFPFPAICDCAHECERGRASSARKQRGRRLFQASASW